MAIGSFGGISVAIMMNSLSSLLYVCQHLPDQEDTIMNYKAAEFNATMTLGKSIAEVGCEPILHMRHYQATGTLPEKLVNQILQQSNGRLLS
ncbi:hypothetical protein ACLOJK_012167 [Asimina triloba]